LEMLHTLLNRYNFDPNQIIPHSGDTPLHSLVSKSINDQQDEQSIEKFNLLFEFGADPKRVNNNGDTLLHVMTRPMRSHAMPKPQNLIFLERLIELGVDINIENNRGETALQRSVRDPESWDFYHDTAIYLVKQHMRNSMDETPLIQALYTALGPNVGETANIDALEMLLSHIFISTLNPRMEMRSGDAIQTFQEPILISALRQKKERAVQVLLRHPQIDVNAVDDQGRTALMHAALNGDEATCRLLLEKNALINIQTRDGSVVDLIAEKIKTYDDSRDNVPLLFYKEIEKLLLKHASILAVKRLKSPVLGHPRPFGR